MQMINAITTARQAAQQLAQQAVALRSISPALSAAIWDQAMNLIKSALTAAALVKAVEANA